MDINKILGNFVGKKPTKQRQQLKPVQNSFQNNFNFNEYPKVEQFKKSKPVKEFKLAGKPVQVFNNNPIPSRKTIEQVYKRIPDDTNIPLQFMTREQYLKQYINNQEAKNKTQFSPDQKQQYIDSEMEDYKNIVGRYTTEKNKYYKPAVVVFNDKPNQKNIQGKNFAPLVWHEFGHEYVEDKKMRMPLHKEEMFADEMARNKKLQQQAIHEYKSGKIQRDSNSKNLKLPITESDFNRDTRLRHGQDKIITIDANKFKTEFEKKHEEQLNWHPLREQTLSSLNEFDSYPELSGNTLDVNDGRHRINEAAKRGMEIDVSVDSENFNESLYRNLGIIVDDNQSKNSSKPNKLLREQLRTGYEVDFVDVKFDKDRKFKSEEPLQDANEMHNLYNNFRETLKRYPGLAKELGQGNFKKIMLTPKIQNKLVLGRNVPVEYNNEEGTNPLIVDKIYLNYGSKARLTPEERALVLRHELEHSKQREGLDLDEHDRLLRDEKDIPYGLRKSEIDAQRAARSFVESHKYNTGNKDLFEEVGELEISYNDLPKEEVKQRIKDVRERYKELKTKGFEKDKERAYEDYRNIFDEEQQEQLEQDIYEPQQLEQDSDSKNSQLYLSRKKNPSALSYTSGNDRIMLGNTKSVSDAEIENHISKIIDHEELHQAILDVAGEDASSGLDNIQGTDYFYGNYGEEKLVNPLTSKDFFTTKEQMQSATEQEAFRNITRDRKSKNRATPNKLLREKIHKLPFGFVEKSDTEGEVLTYPMFNDADYEYNKDENLTKKKVYSLIKKNPFLINEITQRKGQVALCFGDDDYFFGSKNTESGAYVCPAGIDENNKIKKQMIILRSKDKRVPVMTTLHELKHVDQFNNMDIDEYNKDIEENYSESNEPDSIYYSKPYEKEAEEYAIEKAHKYKGFNNPEFIEDAKNYYMHETLNDEQFDEKIELNKQIRKKETAEKITKNLNELFDEEQQTQQDNQSKNYNEKRIAHLGHKEQVELFKKNEKPILLIANPELDLNNNFIDTGRPSFIEKDDEGNVVEEGPTTKIYYHPETKDMALRASELVKSNKRDKLYHLEMGKLLGYSDDEVSEFVNNIKQDQESKNSEQQSYQTLWHAGNEFPSENLNKYGRVYGFSSEEYARGWARWHKYPNLYRFVTTNFTIDPASYERRLADGKFKSNDVEFICYNVLQEELIE